MNQEVQLQGGCIALIVDHPMDQGEYRIRPYGAVFCPPDRLEPGQI